MDEVTIKPQTLEKYKRHAVVVRTALAGVPNNRSYAVDDDAVRSLVAAHRVLWSAVEAGDMPAIDDAEFLKRVAALEPSLVQAWKPKPAEPLPQPWVDPVTGQPLKSPWLPPVDMKAQALLLQVDPKLAQHFMGTAADPYKLVGELRDAALKREKLSRIDYTALTHKTNPFVRGDEPAIAAFVATHDPLVCDIFRDERLPVRCFWSPRFSATCANQTFQSRAVQQDREIGLLLLAAHKVEQLLLEAQRQQAAADAQAAKDRQDGLK